MPAKRLSIRTASHHHQMAVYRLMCELEEVVFPTEKFFEVYSHYIKNPAFRPLVACLDNEVVGFVGVQVQPLLHHGALVAEIAELVVSESVRGGGVGTALFDAAVQHAREAGCVQLELTSSARRVRAHEFYERLGMEKSHVGFTMPLTPIF